MHPTRPEAVLLLRDESVTGAPLYVMERRRGLVIDDSFPEGIERDLCRGISETVVDTVVERHAVGVADSFVDEGMGAYATYVAGGRKA